MAALEEWTTVARKGSKRRRAGGASTSARSSAPSLPAPPSSPSTPASLLAVPVDESSVDALLSDVKTAVDAIDAMDLTGALHQTLRSNELSTAEVVCYGVGSFATASIARAQLAMAESLRRRLLAQSGGGVEGGGVEARGGGGAEARAGAEAEARVGVEAPARGGAEAGGGGVGGGGTPAASNRCAFQASYYDPVTTPLEARVLVRLGWTLVDDESGKHASHGANALDTAGVSTVFYMPHCPFRLYSNVVWANWSPALLSRVAVIGTRKSSTQTTTLI